MMNGGENSPVDDQNGDSSGSQQPDLEQRLLAIRQQFQQQQADLLLQYQQKYAQLTLQHVQASQQLVQEFLHNQHREEQPAPLLRQFSTGSTSHPMAGGGTISDKTKEKLKEMIYNKHHHKQQQQQGFRLTPQFQPYPPQWSPQNELRKATSEPNLKIKGVQALRLKLMEKQQKELQQSKQQQQKQRDKTPPFFFATPSLPNVNLGDAAKLLSPPYWLAAALSNQSKLTETTTTPTSFNLLHAQIRDLVLRRKSLVTEESEDDLRRESENRKEAGPSRAGAGSQTGLAYDSTMCRHQCTCGDNGKHVEHGGRVQSIWARLHETGLADRCEKILSRKAPLDYLKLCHTSSFCTFFGVSPTACLKMDAQDLPLKSFVQLPCGGIGVDSDTYFNDSFTPSAARAAVGCAVELSLAVASGRLRNGLAIVRPPGHHAEPAQALGFCYFNNVAVAARVVKQKFHGQISKIAIVDWDVHHGNGTQIMFESDPDVLYLSLHRHDDGNFFPGTGSAEETGKNEGRGFTINIPWSGEAMGDAEYLAAWRCVVEPVLDQFQPDLILVSCGFDAAAGHWNAVGGYNLSSQMFGWMTARLAARNPVVLILEGGYNLAAISDAAESCVRALLMGQCPATAGQSSDGSQFASAFDRLANESARRTLKRVCEIQQRFWPQVDWAPAFLTQNQFAQSGRLRRQFADLTVEQQQQQSALAETSWTSRGSKPIKSEPQTSSDCSTSSSSGDEKQQRPT